MAGNLPAPWSETNDRTYTHSNLDVEVRIIAASSATIDTGYDVQLVEHAESDYPNSIRLREVKASEQDARELAVEVMNKFGTKYQQAEQDTDTQAKQLSLAVVRTALDYLS